MGIVHGLLRLGFPSVIGRGIIWKYANDIDVVGVAKLCLGGVGQFTAEHQMKKLSHFGPLKLVAPPFVPAGAVMSISLRALC